MLGIESKRSGADVRHPRRDVPCLVNRESVSFRGNCGTDNRKRNQYDDSGPDEDATAQHAMRGCLRDRGRAGRRELSCS